MVEALVLVEDVQGMVDVETEGVELAQAQYSFKRILRSTFAPRQRGAGRRPRIASTLAQMQRVFPSPERQTSSATSARRPLAHDGRMLLQSCAAKAPVKAAAAIARVGRLVLMMNDRL